MPIFLILATAISLSAPKGPQRRRKSHKATPLSTHAQANTDAGRSPAVIDLPSRPSHLGEPIRVTAYHHVNAPPPPGDSPRSDPSYIKGWNDAAKKAQENLDRAAENIANEFLGPAAQMYRDAVGPKPPKPWDPENDIPGTYRPVD